MTHNHSFPILPPSERELLSFHCEMDPVAKPGKVSPHDTTTLDARMVLHMATVHGAKLVGLEDQVGTIEGGKKPIVLSLI